MTNFLKVVSTLADHTWGHNPEDLLRYSADDYLNATMASTAECRERPGAVTRRLMYRLVRALGTADLSAEVFARTRVSNGTDRRNDLRSRRR